MVRSSRYTYSSFLFSMLFALLMLMGFRPLNLYAETPDIYSPPTEPGNSEPYRITEFTVDGPGVLKVFSIAGDIEVETTADSEKVRIELYVDRGYAFWSKSKDLDNYRITMLQRGNEVVASVEEKSIDKGLFSDQMTFSFKVYIPESMSTDLKTFGGHISLSGAKGSHMIKTSGGNIDVSRSRGKIAAYTAGGTITFNKLQGTIFAQTEGGDMYIDDAAGELRLKVKGGDVEAYNISGSMLVQSDGGDIRSEFREITQGINLETSAGNIVADLPDGGFDLNANGSRINLNDDGHFSGSKASNRINGTIRGGGIPVTLRTDYGTVTITVD